MLGLSGLDQTNWSVGEFGGEDSSGLRRDFPAFTGVPIDFPAVFLHPDKQHCDVGKHRRNSGAGLPMIRARKNPGTDGLCFRMNALDGEVEFHDLNELDFGEWSWGD